MSYQLTDELFHPSFDRWNNFGRGIHSHELDLHPKNQRYPRRLSEVRDPNESRIGKDGFKVCLDVEEFEPNEISVKTAGNTIIVEAKHEERQDEHGHVSRQFKRRYSLQEGININDVATELSSDGILTIKAPPKSKALNQETHVLQIQQTGPARLKSGNKENVKSEANDQAKMQNGHPEQAKMQNGDSK